MIPQQQTCIRNIYVALVLFLLLPIANLYTTLPLQKSISSLVFRYTSFIGHSASAMPYNNTVLLRKALQYQRKNLFSNHASNSTITAHRHLVKMLGCTLLGGIGAGIGTYYYVTQYCSSVLEKVQKEELPENLRERDEVAESLMDKQAQLGDVHVLWSTISSFLKFKNPSSKDTTTIGKQLKYLAGEEEKYSKLRLDIFNYINSRESPYILRSSRSEGGLDILKVAVFYNDIELVNLIAKKAGVSITNSDIIYFVRTVRMAQILNKYNIIQRYMMNCSVLANIFESSNYELELVPFYAQEGYVTPAVSVWLLLAKTCTKYTAAELEQKVKALAPVFHYPGVYHHAIREAYSHKDSASCAQLGLFLERLAKESKEQK